MKSTTSTILKQHVNPGGFLIFLLSCKHPTCFLHFLRFVFFRVVLFRFHGKSAPNRINYVYMYIMFGFLFQASKLSQHLYALFFEWIDSCKAYSELFGLAGGLQAGKMMLRRGLAGVEMSDSTKVVGWCKSMMDSSTPKLDWFRHRFLSNDNSYSFSWSRRLNQNFSFSVTAAAFSRSCPGSRVLFSVSAHWIRWIVCLWGKLQIYQRLLKADVPTFAWVPLGFQQSKSGPETPN